MTYLSHYSSPLGPLTLASDGQYLIGLWFDGQKYDRANLQGEQLQEKALPIFDQTKLWLDIYFSGAIPDFTPPLRLTGSDFRQRVLQILLTIPYGHTMTYGEIARIIAQERNSLKSPPKQGDVEGLQNSSHSLSREGRGGSQAVGGAVGHNPISIIIPCHRVLGSTRPKQGSQRGLGPLTGYAGGLDRKLWLLNHEQHHSSYK